MSNKEYYTTGELAKLSGTTYKTIRIYVEKGLLNPDQISEAGYKLFSKNSVEKLQRILMFKYLDFSLEEIKKLMDEEDLLDSLEKQSVLIEQKITHLNQVNKAVNEMKKLSGENKWEKMLDIMKLTSQKEELLNQYKESKKLEARIHIHQYSTAKVEWFDYLLEKCNLEKGMNILDVGCGNGTLWLREKNELPENLNIYLVDNSKAMIDSAREKIREEKKYFENKKIVFHYLVCNANEIGEVQQIKTMKFHRILANHMLYHIDDFGRKSFFAMAKHMMVEDGKFVASTIGENHMKELWELAIQYDDRVKVPGWFSNGFSLENGQKQLEEFFSKVTMHYHKDNLMVPDPEAIYYYMCSLPGGIENIMEKRKIECKKFLKSRVTKKTPFFITKSTGVFVARK